MAVSPPDVGDGNCDPLEEQYTPLTTDPSLLLLPTSGFFFKVEPSQGSLVILPTQEAELRF